MPNLPTNDAPQPGDSVRLRSGGAIMTVERVDRRVEQPYLQCVWMAATAQRKMHKAYVRLDAVEVLTPEALATDTS